MSDYIRVCDLVDRHVAALDYLNRVHGLLTLNLGTGAGHSVLEMVKAFEKVSGRVIPYEIGPRRVGYIGKWWAYSRLAQ